MGRSVGAPKKTTGGMRGGKPGMMGASGFTPSAEAPPRSSAQSTGMAGSAEEEGRVPQPGETIGSYKLLDVIGRGGMGRVYLAEHTVLGRKVALKMLRKRFGQNPQALERFFSEARAVNQIQHENIIEVTDFIQTDEGNTCYIMEILDGRSLAELLESVGTPRQDKALRIALQIADAMVAVHDAQIIHRDLKPENVFLTSKDGRENLVKLLDFGVAKLVDREGRSLHETGIGDAIGTPEYMSPEQLVGGKLDHRSDIYSLGVVLYEMVTGHKPFAHDKSLGEAVFEQLTMKPKPPSQYPDISKPVSPELEELILQCLEKEAGYRPQSMREVRARLDEMSQAADHSFMVASGSFQTPTKAIPPPAGGATEEDDDDEFADKTQAAPVPEFQTPPNTDESLDLVLLPGQIMAPSKPAPPTGPEAVLPFPGDPVPPPRDPRPTSPTPDLPRPLHASQPERSAAMLPIAIGVGVVAGLIVLGLLAWTLSGGGEEDAQAKLIWNEQPVETAPVETAPVETAPVETAPVETAPVETAPVETAPVETAPVETPPVETPPVETPPVETPPVETPPVETPPVETPPAVRPERVNISFESTPPGATVYLAGTERKIGVTPFSRQVRPSKKAALFEFRLDGYKAQERQLAPPTGDTTVSVELKKK
jgi:serine/threonine protein kinase